MNIVCVAAHQDDEMGCLGTLIRLHRERGDRVSFVTLTNGDRGASWSPDVPLAETAAVRAREMRAVADAFDGTYLCLNEPDEFLFDSREVRMRLIEALRSLRAELVFTHFPYEYHQDHVTTAQITCHAALMTEIASIRTESPALERAPGIFHLNPGEGYGFEGTHFVTLSPEVVAEKSRLIRLHVSQNEVIRERLGHDFADRAEERDRLTGARLGHAAAEVFRPSLLDRRIPHGNALP
jgi:LmbE family N-acetylglucosaminyl deacetylase